MPSPAKLLPMALLMMISLPCLLANPGADPSGWTLEARGGDAPWQGRRYHATVTFQDRLWILGGRVAQTGTNIIRNDVWSSADGVNWVQELPHVQSTSSRWAPRWAFGAVVFQDRMWVIGGAGQGGNPQDVWSSPDGVNWTLEVGALEAPWASEFNVRYFHTVTVFDPGDGQGERMWLIGGGSMPRNDVWSSTDGVTWTEEVAHDDAPWDPRSLHTTVVFDNRLWIMGGSGQFSEKYNDVWSSPDGVNWTEEVADGDADWDPRGAHAAATYDGRLWILGGYAGATYSSSMANDVWSSDDGVNWTQMFGQDIWPVRSGHRAAVFDNRLWVLGGYSSSPSEVFYRDVWSSTDGATWHRPVWPARVEHNAIAYDDKLWVLGGDSWAGGTYFNDVWSSPDGVKWSLEAAPPWSPRIGHAVTVFDGKLWLTGGYDGADRRQDVYSFDGNSWTIVRFQAAFPARQHHAMVVHNGRLWIMGGIGVGGELLNDVWSSANGLDWRRDVEHAPWDARGRHGAVAHNGRVWVMGGTDGNYRNDVWSSANGVNWTRELEHAPWASRWLTGAMAVSGGRMWVIGGVTAQGSIGHDIWHSANGVDWETVSATVPDGRRIHAVATFDSRLWLTGGLVDTGGIGTPQNDVWSYEPPDILTILVWEFSPAVVGFPYHFTLTAGGGEGGYAWTANGLPPGFSLDSATGVIESASVDAAPGSYGVTVTVEDDAGNSISAVLPLEVRPVLSLPPQTLPGAVAGREWSAAIAAEGGALGFRWTLEGGSLPPGVTGVGGDPVEASPLTLSGIPMQVGTYEFTLRVTDAWDESATQTFTVGVSTPDLRGGAGAGGCVAGGGLDTRGLWLLLLCGFALSLILRQRKPDCRNV